MTEQARSHFPLHPGKVSTGPAGQKVTSSRTKDAMTGRSLSYLGKINVAQYARRERAARDRWLRKQASDTGLRRESESDLVWVS